MGTGDTYTGKLTYDPDSYRDRSENELYGLNYSWRIDSGDYYVEYSVSGDLLYVTADYLSFYYMLEGAFPLDLFHANSFATEVLASPGIASESYTTFDFANHNFAIASLVYWAPSYPTGTRIAGWIQGDIEWCTVPESASIIFLGTGLVGLLGLVRKKY
jgi:hypothetical protein